MKCIDSANPNGNPDAKAEGKQKATTGSKGTKGQSDKKDA